MLDPYNSGWGNYKSEMSGCEIETAFVIDIDTGIDMVFNDWKFAWNGMRGLGGNQYVDESVCMCVCHKMREEENDSMC